MYVYTDITLDRAKEIIESAVKGQIWGNVMITHNGVFHAHEVFACALMSPSIVIRTRNQEIIGLAGQDERNTGQILVVDVGGKSDGKIYLDHHQTEGYPGIEGMFFFKKDDTRMLTNSPYMKMLLDDIGKIDCGILGKDYVSRIIRSYNSAWCEAEPDAYGYAQNVLFESAVELAEMVLNNPQHFLAMRERALTHIDAKEKARQMAETNLIPGHDILIIERYYPIMDFIHEQGHETKFIIYPNYGQESWKLHAVSKSKEDMQPRVPIDVIVGMNGCTMIHPNKFLAIFESLEGAIKTAISCLGFPKYEHDCDYCEFLGRYKDLGTDTELDVYKCENTSMIVFRVSPNPFASSVMPQRDWMKAADHDYHNYVVHAKKQGYLPVYKHDCSWCTFLGGFMDEQGDRRDLYYCDQMAEMPTLISRYGSEGAEYVSGSAEDNPELEEAQKRAKVRGLQCR